jgi:spore germination protein KB
MLDNGKISAAQLGVLVFLYTVGTTILIIPSGLAATAKQDAWIGALAGVGIGLVFLWLYSALWRLFPHQTFVGLCETLLGNIFGKILSVVFIFYSFIGSATVLYYLGNFFKTQFIPQTPLPIVNGLFAIVLVFGIKLGLESISRASEIMLPWFIILFVVLVVSLALKIKFENIQPVLESGIKPIAWSGLSFAGTAYLPIISLFAVFPNVRNSAQARKGFFVAAIIGGLCVVLITLLCILILGPNITSRSMFPSYALAKKINIGNFFQRIEAFMAGLWFITTYIKTTFYFYGWVTSFAELLKLKDHRFLAVPFGMILVVFSLVVYPNVAYMQNWDSTVFLPYILTIGLLLPLILLAAGFLQKAGIVHGKTRPRR